MIVDKCPICNSEQAELVTIDKNYPRSVYDFYNEEGEIKIQYCPFCDRKL